MAMAAMRSGPRKSSIGSLPAHCIKHFIQWTKMGRREEAQRAPAGIILFKTIGNLEKMKYVVGIETKILMEQQ